MATLPLRLLRPTRKRNNLTLINPRLHVRALFIFACACVVQRYVSLIQKFGPIMNPGGSAISLTYIASEKVKELSFFNC